MMNGMRNGLQVFAFFITQNFLLTSQKNPAQLGLDDKSQVLQGYPTKKMTVFPAIFLLKKNILKLSYKLWRIRKKYDQY